MEADGTRLYQRHWEVADNDLLLAKLPFKVGPPPSPVLQIYFIGHDFEDENVVSVSGWPIAPEPLRRRLQMGSHAVKAVGQFLLHPFEIFPSKGLTFVVGARQQDLHKMHDEEPLKTLNGHIGIRVPGMLGAAKGGNAGPQAR